MKKDLVLVEEVKQGNVEAFSELVLRYQRVLLRMAVRMTRDLEVAEDIVQESFMKAYTKIDTFQGRSSFKSWVYQIALNTAKNKLRSKKYTHVTVDKMSLAINTNLDGDVFREDIKLILQEEIEKLPEKQKLALTLRIFEDLSFKEISEIMDSPYDTAKANYRHALMKLRHRFEENENLKSLKDFNTMFSADLDLKGFAVEVD